MIDNTINSYNKTDICLAFKKYLINIDQINKKQEVLTC